MSKCSWLELWLLENSCQQRIITIGLARMLRWHSPDSRECVLFTSKCNNNSNSVYTMLTSSYEYGYILNSNCVGCSGWESEWANEIGTSNELIRYTLQAMHADIHRYVCMYVYSQQQPRNCAVFNLQYFPLLMHRRPENRLPALGRVLLVANSYERTTVAVLQLFHTGVYGASVCVC